TNTPENTPTNTPENTPTNTPENTPTNTPEATLTSTPENTPTSTPEEETPTPKPEKSKTPEATRTPRPHLTVTPTPPPQLPNTGIKTENQNDKEDYIFAALLSALAITGAGYAIHRERTRQKFAYRELTSDEASTRFDQPK
ncbi:MAG: hypothetical protein Q8Q49_04545, partial [bacterium]|nr:hypothetical protein [bacterium]